MECSAFEEEVVVVAVVEFQMKFGQQKRNTVEEPLGIEFQVALRWYPLEWDVVRLDSSPYDIEIDDASFQVVVAMELVEGTLDGRTAGIVLVVEVESSSLEVEELLDKRSRVWLEKTFRCTLPPKQFLDKYRILFDSADVVEHSNDAVVVRELPPPSN